jgi:hypothetical protein
MNDTVEAQYYSDIVSNYGRSSSLVHELEGCIPRFVTGAMKWLGVYKPPLKVPEEITIQLPWIPYAKDLTNYDDNVVDELFDYLSDIVQRCELEPNRESTVSIRLNAGSANDLWATLGCRDDDQRLDCSPEILNYLMLTFNQKFEQRYGVQCSGTGMNGSDNRNIRFKIKHV